MLDLATLRGLTEGGQRSLFVSAVIPWTSWKAAADLANSDQDPTNDLPVPYCKWTPTHPSTGQPLAKSWFRAFADGDYDTRLRAWLTGVDSLGAPGDNPVLVSLMAEMDRLDALPTTFPYRSCVGTPEEFRAGWARAYAVAGGAIGGPSLNAADGTGGRLIWVPVFTGWAFNYTAGYDAPERPLVDFRTGLPPPGAPPNEATLEIARATPWLPPTGSWDQVGIDEFNFSGAVAGKVVPTRIKVDDPLTTEVETDQWRSLQVLMQPVLLWSTHHAPRPDGSPGTVFLAEVGSVPDPTRPQRRPDWIQDACGYLESQPRIVGSLYFDTNTVRLSTWSWTKHADGSWHAAPNPTDTDHASVAAWGELMASPRAGGTTSCGGIGPPPDDQEWIGNRGVEENLVGWAGKYGASPIVTRVSGGHDSSWAIEVRATSAGPTSAGVSDQPRWMTSTVAGTTYVASAWVKAGGPASGWCSSCASGPARRWSPPNASSGERPARGGTRSRCR